MTMQYILQSYKEEHIYLTLRHFIMQLVLIKVLLKTTIKTKLDLFLPKGVSISAYMLNCKGFAVYNYNFGFLRNASAINLTLE